VLIRADGQFAYQLAVVVDDAWQGVTHVVRGADLLLSTPRQAYLQRLLGMPNPDYLHLPLAVDRQGRKLSKQLASAPVNPSRPTPALLAALRHMDQEIPDAEGCPARDVLEWAIAHWNPGRIQSQRIRIVA
jgi:glutamyl-Q tRNA(Asp) synthetase